MSDSPDNGRIDEALRRALRPTRLQLDFLQWQREHAEAVETVQSWKEERSEYGAGKTPRVSVVQWTSSNRFKIAGLLAAAAVLVLVLSSGVLDHEGHRSTASNEQQNGTPHPRKQSAEAPNPNQTGQAVAAVAETRPEETEVPVAPSTSKESDALDEDPSRPRYPVGMPEVRAPLTAEDPTALDPHVVQPADADWLPFSREEIRAVSILAATETGSGKKLIARVSSEHHDAVFACLARSRPPDDDSGCDGEWTREAVIELKDGRSFVLSYHGECEAPEYRFARRGTDEHVTRWSQSLKELLGRLESGKDPPDDGRVTPSLKDQSLTL